MRRSHGWLRLTSFVPRQGSPGKLTVSVEADLLEGRRPPRDLRLLARRGGKITAHRPISSDLERISGSRLARRSQVFHWRVTFELPATVGEDRRVSFQLLAEPDPALDLPELGWQTSEPRPIYERPTPRVGAFLAAAAALLAGLAPGFALADGSSPASSASSTALAQTTTTGTSTDTGSTTLSQPPATTTTVSQPTATTTTISQPPTTTSAPPPPTTTQTTTTTSTTPTGTKSGSGNPSGGGGGSKKRPTHHRSHPGSRHHHGPAHNSGKHRSGKHHSTKHHPGSHRSAKHGPGRHTGGASSAPRHHSSQPAPATPTPAPGSETSFSTPVLTDLLTPAQLRTYNVLVGGMVEPPVFLQRIYRAAGRRYGIPWQVLAAINYVETRYGKDLAVSPAGAIGWMQFMPATWAQYGESVNLKGKPAPGLPNPWDPTDAIFAAARYLKAAGAGPNLPGAVYAYNHAGWYVQEVLSIAEEINRHNMWPQRHASRKVAAMLTMARLLDGLPYVWGGGHSNFTMVEGGYDCSGFVSAVLHAGGYLEGPVTTQTLPGQPLILPGRGRYVTIRDRTYLSADQDHVIIDIKGQWWESGGWGVFSDRVHRMHHVTRAYLDSFNLILHPRGL